MEDVAIMSREEDGASRPLRFDKQQKFPYLFCVGNMYRTYILLGSEASPSKVNGEFNPVETSPIKLLRYTLCYYYYQLC